MAKPVRQRVPVAPGRQTDAKADIWYHNDYVVLVTHLR